MNMPSRQGKERCMGYRTINEHKQSLKKYTSLLFCKSSAYSEEPPLSHSIGSNLSSHSDDGIKSPNQNLSDYYGNFTHELANQRDKENQMSLSSHGALSSNRILSKNKLGYSQRDVILKHNTNFHTGCEGSKMNNIIALQQHPLRHELKERSKKCFANCKRAYRTKKEKNLKVNFSDPLVTLTKHRPYTDPEDIPRLFFDQDELDTLEADRRGRLAEDQIECVANRLRDDILVSISFPNPKRLSRRELQQKKCRKAGLSVWPSMKAEI